MALSLPPLPSHRPHGPLAIHLAPHRPHAASIAPEHTSRHLSPSPPAMLPLAAPVNLPPFTLPLNATTLPLSPLNTLLPPVHCLSLPLAASCCLYAITVAPKHLPVVEDYLLVNLKNTESVC
ncbi:hypothetical protein K439DRAFT_1611499 [Ramaria rubella]|nr:hypothetical protein K439DRAFT_1611499 [Ramaria rubella]